MVSSVTTRDAAEDHTHANIKLQYHTENVHWSVSGVTRSLKHAHFLELRLEFVCDFRRVGFVTCDVRHKGTGVEISLFIEQNVGGASVDLFLHHFLKRIT